MLCSTLLALLFAGGHARLFSANPDAPAAEECDESLGACAAARHAGIPPLPASGSWIADPGRLLSLEATATIESNLTSINATSGMGVYLVILSALPEAAAGEKASLKDAARKIQRGWFPQEGGTPEARMNKRLGDKTTVLVVLVSTGRAELWMGVKARRRMTPSQARARAAAFASSHAPAS